MAMRFRSDLAGPHGWDRQCPLLQCGETVQPPVPVASVRTSPGSRQYSATS